MTRRIALRGGALAAAGAMVSPQLVAVLQTPPQTQDREGFEAFVERAQRQVATLYNDAPPQTGSKPETRHCERGSG
jgi:hypothetical protein